MSVHSTGGGKSHATLGRILRQLRGDRTQMEVAAAISRSYLSELESDKHGSRIPRHTLVGLAEALNVEPGVLLAAAGQPVQPADIRSPRPDFVSFVLTEPTLDESARAAILAVYQLAVPNQPAVVNDGVDPDFHLVESGGHTLHLLAKSGGERRAVGGGERLGSTADHRQQGGLESGKEMADDCEVGGGPLGQVE